MSEQSGAIGVTGATGATGVTLDTFTLDHLNRQDVVLAELKGSIKELGSDIQQVKIKVTETNGRVTKTEHKVISDANMLEVLFKGFDAIENRELERVKEAHDDRKALKIAIYSFIVAITASGLGALIIVLLG